MDKLAQAVYLLPPTLRSTQVTPSIADYFQDMKLPTMPEVARFLMQSLNNDDIPFEKVRSAISRDQALAVKLIRLANSARFGSQRKVSPVDEAITKVGLNQLRTLCLAACMADAFPVAPRLNREEF